ncbi:hypothetical protein AB0K89_11510 [Streptomyces cinnamoneus]|uniref:hypothetical protein n=1 Tax=Streptomyces cinnamoneus TaxID=53446 RepID=UPI00344671D5
MKLIRRLLVMFAATSVLCLSGAGTAAAAPLPGADELLGQVKALGDLGGVLTPVTDVINAALQAGG